MAEDALKMPPEWAPHRRTWMAWPARTDLWGGGLEEAKRAYAEVANAIAEFEPVSMIASPDLVAEASLHCDKGVKVVPMPHDDSWTRDTGPVFVLDEGGKPVAVDFRFNGWGGAHPDFAEDARMAARIAERAGFAVLASDLVLEGGGVHVDGEGTALVCAGSLLDPNRNPKRDKASIEAELARTLGIKTCLWLPYGLEDDETAGHVDNLACFVGPGRALALDPETAPAGDRDGLRQNLDVLKGACDAAGRTLDVRTLPCPKPKNRADGRRLTRTYANFYLCNGALIMPEFNTSADDRAYYVLAEAFPDRTIVQIEADPLLQGGGGIHCVTLQEPVGG